MTITPFMEVLPHLVSTFTLDGDGLGLIAVLVGIAGGFYITSYRDQLKAKKAKIERKNELDRRK